MIDETTKAFIEALEGFLQDLKLERKRIVKYEQEYSPEKTTVMVRFIFEEKL